MAAASHRAAALALLWLPLARCFECSRGDQLGTWTPKQQAYCCRRDEEGCILEGRPAPCQAQIERLLGGSVATRSLCNQALSLVSDRCPQCRGCANLAELCDAASAQEAEPRERQEEQEEQEEVHTTRAPPADREYDCGAHVASWETSWSPEQKEWCCCKWSDVGAFVSCEHVAATREERSQVCRAYTFPTTTSTRTATADPFACDDLDELETWSADKKEWCCLHRGKACPDFATSSRPFECAPGGEDGWGPAQRQFCCAFAGSGCPLTTAPLPVSSTATTTSAPLPSATTQASSTAAATTGTQVVFECHEGVADWETGWSELKQDYCCKTAGVACPITSTTASSPADAAVRFDCDADSGNWEDSWSRAKTAWCCRHEKVGCSPGKIPDATWEVIFAGEVRVRSGMSPESDILKLLDRGAVVDGRLVSARDGSKWLKLSDAAGFMMRETPDGVPLLAKRPPRSDDGGRKTEEVYALPDDAGLRGALQKKYLERGLAKVKEASLAAPGGLLVALAVLGAAAVTTGCRSTRGRTRALAMEVEPLCAPAASPTAAGADV